jgi:hypothetical protein
MNTSYRFTSDLEPTEKELELLMNDVISDVIIRAKKADLKFKELQKLQINQALQRQKLHKNGGL